MATCTPAYAQASSRHTARLQSAWHSTVRLRTSTAPPHTHSPTNNYAHPHPHGHTYPSRRKSAQRDDDGRVGEWITGACALWQADPSPLPPGPASAPTPHPLPRRDPRRLRCKRPLLRVAAVTAMMRSASSGLDTPLPQLCWLCLSYVPCGVVAGGGVEVHRVYSHPSLPALSLMRRLPKPQH